MTLTPTRSACRGFTLVEMLVVVIIIAIVASMMLLSVNVLGRDTQITEESQRLMRLIGVVQEQAEMQSRDVGLTFYPDGYEFLRHDVRRDIWTPVTDNPLLRQRKLPPGVVPRLMLEGRDVILKPRSEHEGEEDEDEDEKKKKNEQPPPPQVFIYASGDLTPFDYTLEREGSDHSATVTGEVNGTVKLKSVDEEPRK